MMMSWLRKATILTRRSFVSSLSSHMSIDVAMPKSLGIPSYLSGLCETKIQHLLMLNAHHYATDFSNRLVNSVKDECDNKKVNLDVISKEIIKPSYPTPKELKTFNLSIIDQTIFNYYTPLIVCIPNTDNTHVTDVITKRSRLLKESLSKLLTKYYPFAGEIKGDYQIHCNDKGVYFVEARINQTLEEFLRQPHDRKVRELNPKHPSTTKDSFGNYVLSVQVNIFSCGGIGLCTTLSHKFVDGNSYITFMKAWAAAARGSSEIIPPSFVASEIFPYSPLLQYSLPPKFLATKELITKRFVFDSTSLASLKSKLASSTSPPSHGPSRTEAITSLIWKAAAKAASTVRSFNPQSPHALLTFVNFRGRASPPLPKESIGNLFEAAVAVCFPKTQPDLSSLMHQMRESIAKVDSDHIESFKGENGYKVLNKVLKMMNDVSNVMDEGDFLFVSSLLNNGMYEIDFGWGKPIWFYHMNPGSPRVICLNDMIKGGGVEAIVTLSLDEMELFERDPDVLSHAIVNPSPLQFLN